MRSSTEISILISLAWLRWRLRHYVLYCGPMHVHAGRHACINRSKTSSVASSRGSRYGLGMRHAFAAWLQATEAFSCDQSSYCTESLPFIFPPPLSTTFKQLSPPPSLHSSYPSLPPPLLLSPPLLQDSLLFLCLLLHLNMFNIKLYFRHTLNSLLRHRRRTVTSRPPPSSLRQVKLCAELRLLIQGDRHCTTLCYKSPCCCCC